MVRVAARDLLPIEAVEGAGSQHQHAGRLEAYLPGGSGAEFLGSGRQKVDDAEVTRLKRENARLKKEQNPTQTAAYFAKHSR